MNARTLRVVVVLAGSLVAPEVFAADAPDAGAPAAEAAPPAPPAVPSPPGPAPEPALDHAPVAAVPLGEDLVLPARIHHPERLRRAVLVYRSGGATKEVAFERAAQGTLPWVATIPASDVTGDAIAYAIELERLDGARAPSFAERGAMHPVQVVGDVTDARERVLLERLGGRRSVVTASGEYAYFGRLRADPVAGDAAPPAEVLDNFWRLEGAFTYRILRTVSEFGLRTGVLRGRTVTADSARTGNYDVGLNYASARLRLRATDWLHVEGELLSSITEVGFSVGGGGAALLGDPYASYFMLGFETIEGFGTRGYSRVHIVASRRISVAPVIEVTNVPHANATGVRLLGEVGFELGSGFELLITGGYQARSFNSGGPSAGSALRYAF